MKYYLDTEFIEGFHRPLFGKRRHFIDLVSIALVCEDGRSYYAISRDYRWQDADDWVKQNVLMPIFKEQNPQVKLMAEPETINQYVGLPNWLIAEQLEEFIEQGKEIHGEEKGAPEFWAYFADYDWVVFCSLFGRMINLPKGYPMYCRDLKQLLDETATTYGVSASTLKASVPKQKVAHNALDDALWNLALHQHITDRRRQMIPLLPV